MANRGNSNTSTIDNSANRVLLDSATALLDKLASEPEHFVHAASGDGKAQLRSRELQDNLKSLTKSIFDMGERGLKLMHWVMMTRLQTGKQFEGKTIGPLETLVVDRFDSEQIWAELQLQVRPPSEHVRRVTRATERIDGQICWKVHQTHA
jgi:hypothetical protein